VATPRLPEKVGQFCREGDLICTVDDCTCVEVEVALRVQDVAKVRPGQEVDIKVRALPFETLRGKVERVAPAAVKGDVQATVTAYVRIDRPPPGVRPGMTGTARVSCGRSTVANVLGGRALRYLRTEFWW
jgi:multidrug efflux pump subunit AcrA (membrane-fusion protein)